MKKSLLIFCTTLVAFSLMAFAYLNRSPEASKCMEIVSNNPDFIFKVEPRFLATITKEDLLNAKSVIDIYPKEATQWIDSYQEVGVAILHEDVNVLKSAEGLDDRLNPAQLELLHSIDFSTNIRITSNCAKRTENLGNLEPYDLVYYMTVTPKNYAEYEHGNDDLIKYLKDNSAVITANLNRNLLQPGKASFTVTPKGTIENVTLISTSGYFLVDNHMLDLLNSMPGKWKPATDSSGQKVEQELVFFFGIQGC